MEGVEVVTGGVGEWRIRKVRKGRGCWDRVIESRGDEEGKDRKGVTQQRRR